MCLMSRLGDLFRDLRVLCGSFRVRALGGALLLACAVTGIPHAERVPARVDVLRATGALPAHVTGVFQEPIAFQQAKSGRYYIFDRRAHTVYSFEPGAEAPKPIVKVGAEAGNILQPSAFDLEPFGSFVVADSPNNRERVQAFDANGFRIGGFTLPGKNAIRLTIGNLVLNGVGSLQYTGRSVLVNLPETGALITEYTLNGVPFRSFGVLRRTGQESDPDLHLGLNVGMPVVNPRSGYYFVFLTGVPMFRAYDSDGKLLFERHIEGPELDQTIANLPTQWPRRKTAGGSEMPLLYPVVRTAAADVDGNLWVSLTDPYTYVYDALGEKRRTLQFRSVTGVLAPTSLFFADANRLLVTPGCYEFKPR